MGIRNDNERGLLNATFATLTSSLLYLESCLSLNETLPPNTPQVKPATLPLLVSTRGHADPNKVIKDRAFAQPAKVAVS
jgi:hypothetical protein